MKVRFHTVNFTADIKLLDFIQKKMNKLDLYYGNVVNADAYLKVEPSSNRENKYIELKVSVPGKELVVKKHSKSFEEATDVSVEALRRSLVRYKDKLKAVV
jgi:putative sigma-54 modulation protein